MLMLKSATDTSDFEKSNQRALDARSCARAGARRNLLQLDCVTEGSDFLALEADWNKLFSEAGVDQHVFQSFSWLHHWYAVFVEDVSQNVAPRLTIVTGRINDELVMVWPLVEKRSFGFKTIEWMGAPVSQYGDVLLARGPDQSLWVEAGLEYIKTQLKPDALLLHKVRADSQLAGHVGNVKVTSLGTEDAPFLDLSKFESFADFRAAYSTRTRKTRSRKRRRLLERPGATAEIYTSGTRSSEIVDGVLNIKRQWLEERNVVSRAFSSTQIDVFMQRVVTATERSVHALITAVSIEGKLIAGEIGFRNKDTYFSHIAAYDLEHAKLSAGVLQFEDTVAHCIENGIQTIDLLAPADPYKLQWATGAVSVDNLAIPCSLKGYAAVALNSGLSRTWMRKFAHVLPKSVRTKLTAVVSKVL